MVASLGFSYHHVMAAANRCRPDRIILVTVNPEVDRVKNAVDEILIYGKRLGVEVSVTKLMPEEFWHCVENAAGVFAEDGEYFLDIGGGVRALSLCLLTAAVLAATFWDARISVVYTMAEHAERVVEIDLRPVLYAKKLADPRAKTRRELLQILASSGWAEAGRYEREVAREFAEFGLADEGGLTAAGRALARIIELSRARRGQA